MNKNRNQNNLLVEIMIAVLFFALCSTVILETFMASRELGIRSTIESAALVQLQDIGEQLYAAENPEEVLENAGFTAEEGAWVLENGETRLESVLSEEETEAGTLRTWQLRGLRKDKEFADIPGARYIPGGEMP